ncbi:hypothetical protein GCM10020229_62910 [Kitasatospora albolonga]|uniref:hypothetical protein n=1 Tax=Kitasatospora albolonga TaxID=68173 RepID=UPI0031E80595
MSIRMRRWALAGAAVAVAAVLGAPALATAADNATDNALAPFGVEDGAYPGADQILQEKGITLTAGDGQINLVSCTQGHQIELYSKAGARDPRDRYCFSAPASAGWLTMSIPEVYTMSTTAERALTATVSIDGNTATLQLPKNGAANVGEHSVSNHGVVLELRITG